MDAETRATDRGDAGLETVATFAFRGDAEVAKALLASAGIQSIVAADDEGGLNPGFYQEYRIRLLVAEALAPEARDVLENAT